MQIHIFLHNCAGVCDSGVMIFMPNVFDFMCGLSFNHRQFHDFSEFPWTWVSKGHCISYFIF